MTAFDYTTVPAAFAYGGIAGTATDPVNEATVMAGLVTAASRAIDRHCQQRFSQESYSGQVLRGVVDADGVLICYPPVPTMSAPTSAAYRAGGTATWQALPSLDVETANHGCTVRALGLDLSALRFQRVQVQLSYTGGWASSDALPDEFATAATALAWWLYQKRSAPQEKTAIPELGVLIIPGNWPGWLRDMLAPYVRVTA